MNRIEGIFTQRYNGAELLAKVNPILLAGEIGIESDTGRFKFGAGDTEWNKLAYADSAIRLPIYEALPAADKKYYGQLALLAQEKDDILVVCLKKNDKYIWQKIREEEVV